MRIEAARASSDAYDRHMKATQQFDEEAERIKNGARAVLEVRGVMEEAAKRSQAAAPPPTVGKGGSIYIVVDG